MSDYETKKPSSGIVDVHTHLTDSSLFQDIRNIIDRALQNDVRAALVVAEKFAEFSSVLELSERYPKFVVPCLGVHPIQATGKIDEKGIEIKRSVIVQDYDGVEEAIEKAMNVIGCIGEIGLDFSPRFCPTSDDKEVQKLILTRQVRLAQRLDLSINVHSRSAGKQTVQLLKELGAQHVLLHAFDGRASVALEGVSSGFYFSVTASICRDPQLQKMVKMLPLGNLMVETDSPAIAPIKGTVNEPANALIACEHIAKIKKVDIEDVKRITTENAVKVFPKLKTLLQ